MRVCGRAVLLALLVFASRASAFDLGVSDSPLSVEVHGFASQGFIYTTENNYLAEGTTRGSFEFTEVGINFSKTLTERLRVGMQLFARDLGPIGNYAARFDWFHVDYRFRDWLGIRAGRVKLPVGLYNDSSDIDAARVPILLPQSVYPTGNRDVLLAQTGTELYGYLSLGRGGGLDYRAYAGTIFLDIPRRGTSAIEVDKVSVPYVAGGRILWDTPLSGLRIGGSAQALRLDTVYTFNQAIQVGIRVPVFLWVASAEYTFRNLQLAAEYARWHLRLYSDNQAVYPNTTAYSERAYAMASYRITSWFQPGFYYSYMRPTNVDRTFGHDFTATLRFDINSFWLVKLEGHYMHGTGLLDGALNGGIPPINLPSKWGLFLIKTTATF